MRVHQNDCDKDTGNPIPGAFRNRPKDNPQSGMSTDWEKYASPQDTRNRGAKAATEYAVLGLSVAEIRRIPNQVVEHTPIPTNRSHTDVFGEKTSEVRVRLLKAHRMLIRVGEK